MAGKKGMKWKSGKGLTTKFNTIVDDKTGEIVKGDAADKNITISSLLYQIIKKYYEVDK